MSLPLALRGVFWVVVYGAVTIAPLLAARVGAPVEGKGFVVDFSIALGFIGLAIMMLQFALVARLQQVSAPFGMDSLHQYHRQISYVALAFVLAHPVLLFIENPERLALLNPVTAPARARFALAATVLLLLLVATSVFRQKFRLSYEWWQVLHGVFAVGIVVFALLHMLGWNHYVATPWQRGLWLGVGVSMMAIVAWLRVIRPLRHRWRPWKVAEVIPERGNAWSVVMAPDGHDGVRFQAGQFGWVLLGESPFRVTQHPFSFSSSADHPERLVMTIKARGDFTAGVKDLAVGARAFVDGPHGLFTLDRNEGPGFVFIAGGVGITPLISMLRTLRDRGDVRPCWLFYGNKDWETITFREELARMEDELSLTVVHVLEAPHEGCEEGFVRPELLRKHLPDDGYRRLQYFVCGPPPMMDAMEHALLEVGVPDERIHTERFEMV